MKLGLAGFWSALLTDCCDGVKREIAITAIFCFFLRAGKQFHQCSSCSCWFYHPLLKELYSHYSAATDSGLFSNCYNLESIFPSTYAVKVIEGEKIYLVKYDIEGKDIQSALSLSKLMC